MQEKAKVWKNSCRETGCKTERRIVWRKEFACTNRVEKTMDSVRFARIRLARRDFAPRLIEFSKIPREEPSPLLYSPLPFSVFSPPPSSLLPSFLLVYRSILLG